MSSLSRNKGSRIEREIVRKHDDAGLPCEKISRSGYTGPDLECLGEFKGEVKARKGGKGWATIEGWLEGSDFLFLRQDRRDPIVVMTWDMYVDFAHALLRLEQ